MNELAKYLVKWFQRHRSITSTSPKHRFQITQHHFNITLNYLITIAKDLLNRSHNHFNITQHSLNTHPNISWQSLQTHTSLSQDNHLQFHPTSPHNHVKPFAGYLLNRPHRHLKITTLWRLQTHNKHVKTTSNRPDITSTLPHKHLNNLLNLC